MNKILYWLSARPLFALIGKGYTVLRKALDNIPGFDAFHRLAVQVTDRVFGIVKLPASVEQRFEPYIEFQRGRQMDRALVMVLLVYMAILGAYPSSLGHLDTAPQIWIALPIVSGFNPYLGLVSGVVFSVFDWLGKWLPFESVYGADFGGGIQNFFGARIGYILAYTTLILNGMLPGVLARIFRQFVRGIAPRILPRKAGQAAMGIIMLLAAGWLLYRVGGPDAVYAMSAISLLGFAMAMGPPPPGMGSPCIQCGTMLPPGVHQCGCGGISQEARNVIDKKNRAAEEARRRQEYENQMRTQGAGGGSPPPPPMPPPEVGGDYLYEALATVGSMLGATVGIVVSYEWAQQVGNYGAFYALRAEPDVSCRDLSAGNYGELQAQSPIPGAVSGAMPPGAAGAMTGGGTPDPGVMPDPNPPAPRTSRWIRDENGRDVPQIYDPSAGGWRTARGGDVDADGDIYDPNQPGGAWVSAGVIEGRQRDIQGNLDMQQRERDKIDQRRRDAERRMREAEARRQRIAELERRQADAARRRLLEQRQRRLEREAGEAHSSMRRWEVATTAMEGLKWTIDTTANVVAAASPEPAGRAFSYVYGGLTGMAEGATTSYLSGGSVLEGGATGAGEGLFTAALGNLVGDYLPGAGNTTRPTGAFIRGSTRAIRQGAGYIRSFIRGSRGFFQQFVREGARSGARTVIIGEATAHASSTMWGTATSDGGYGGLSDPRYQGQTDAVRGISRSFFG